MKLNKSTIEVLKNFAGINNGMVIHQGARIRTQDNLNKQIAYADIEDSFPVEFAVYDLGEFLSALNLLDNAELDFQEKYVVVTGDGGAELTFQYANAEFVTEAPEKLNFPEDSDVVHFDLKGEALQKIKKASATLGLSDICVSTVAGSDEIILSATDAQGSSKHKFGINVGEVGNDVEFKFFFKAERLNIVDQDYKVSIHPAGISRFTGLSLEYFIATEAL
ncbi:sliding clamp DNA polymerase accessory protein [Vibrio phage nt-1]|uniref:Sliding clamp n=1 Tax=Vibrio phage nt-1 TaxID=115992 RepID=R9TEF1_9CAUD|nr:DNA polymerase processivity factor [Vibrio phage nt-1]AGN30126.1 sliding clamp DNA polymerase accessory protein [Vibrio phage nt-1]